MIFIRSLPAPNPFYILILPPVETGLKLCYDWIYQGEKAAREEPLWAGGEGWEFGGRDSWQRAGQLQSLHQIPGGILLIRPAGHTQPGELVSSTEPIPQSLVSPGKQDITKRKRKEIILIQPNAKSLRKGSSKQDLATAKTLWGMVEHLNMNSAADHGLSLTGNGGDRMLPHLSSQHSLKLKLQSSGIHSLGQMLEYSGNSQINHNRARKISWNETFIEVK